MLLKYSVIVLQSESNFVTLLLIINIIAISQMINIKHSELPLASPVPLVPRSPPNLSLAKLDVFPEKLK